MVAVKEKGGLFMELILCIVKIVVSLKFWKLFESFNCDVWW